MAVMLGLQSEVYELFYMYDVQATRAGAWHQH